MQILEQYFPIKIRQGFTLISLLLITIFTDAQTISISDARSKPEGDTVTIKGIITADEFGSQKYIQDNTAGIALYSSTIIGLKKGDSVLVEGVIKFYNGETELSPVNNFTVLNSGNALPAPKVLSLTQGFTELYEGQLIRFNDVSFSNTGNFDAGTSGKNFAISFNSIAKEIRVKPETNIPGMNIPSGKINIIGVMGHYKNTYGTDKYQLYPRSRNDFLLGKGPVINTSLIQTDIEHTSFSVSFGTQFPGNTIIKYGLSKSLEIGFVEDSLLTLSHQINLTNLTAATFYYVKAYSIDAYGDTSASNIQIMSTASLSSGDIKIYFNKPVDNSYAYYEPATYLNKLIDDTLCAYINRARESIDLAIYSFNNTNLSANISSALNSAHGRGVKVRVVADGGNYNPGVTNLSGPAIMNSPQGSEYSIMHNKFLVIDAISSNPDYPIVWTGSTNFTDNQIYDDANNVIIVQDQSLAKAYRMEFEEMWGSSTQTPNYTLSKFGKFKTDNTPHLFNIGGKEVESYFSPSDLVTAKIIDKIATADYDIYFATMGFTRPEIATAIVNRVNKGVYAAGIFDNFSGSNADAYDVLNPVLDSNVLDFTGTGIFHHKYMIVDQSASWSDPLVLSGSHNWSKSADESNDENTLVIHDKNIANLYFQEWVKRFKESGGTVFIGYQNETNNKPESLVSNACILNQNLIANVNVSKPQSANISVINLQGQTVYTQNIRLTAGNNHLYFPLPSLKNQIYLLRITAEEFVFSGKMNAN